MTSNVAGGMDKAPDRCGGGLGAGGAGAQAVRRKGEIHRNDGQLLLACDDSGREVGCPWAALQNSYKCCCATFTNMKFLIVIIASVAASVVAVLILQNSGIESAGLIGGGVGGAVAGVVASRVFSGPSSSGE